VLTLLLNVHGLGELHLLMVVPVTLTAFLGLGSLNHGKNIFLVLEGVTWGETLNQSRLEPVLKVSKT